MPPVLLPQCYPKTPYTDSNKSFLSYRTGEYKLHYFETATNLKFVMLTDTRIASMRTVLYQIWANLYVEYVVKSPISPVEHTGGVGVANELFEGALESFIVRVFWSSDIVVLCLHDTYRILSFLLLEHAFEDTRKRWRLNKCKEAFGRELTIRFGPMRINFPHHDYAEIWRSTSQPMFL